MTWMIGFARPRVWGAALLALSFACGAATAATVKIKNSGYSDVRIAFDRGQAITVAPGSTTQTTLNAGDHAADCRFDGTYDGCNLAANFTLGDVKELELNLRPTLTLEHAVTLTKDGTMRAETGRDYVWATNTLDVQGSAADCADYSTGKLAPVSTRVKGRRSVGNLSVTTRTLCGEPKAVVGVALDGAQLYFEPRFLIFRDSRGRQILVTQ